MHGPSPPGYIMGFLAHPMVGCFDNPGGGERWIMTCVVYIPSMGRLYIFTYMNGCFLIIEIW